mgnify:CR=1 FL=1
MKRSFGKLFPAAVAALVCGGVACAAAAYVLASDRTDDAAGPVLYAFSSSRGMSAETLLAPTFERTVTACRTRCLSRTRSTSPPAKAMWPASKRRGTDECFMRRSSSSSVSIAAAM